MKATDFTQHSDQELRAMIRENESTLQDMRFNNRITPVEKPHRISQIRADVARMNTLLRQRELTAKAI
jgi:large subunit ribosomal protein L29